MNNGVFKKLGVESRVLLSPMAGVTDRAFREICSNYGLAYFTSEMVSAKGLIYKNAKTYELIEHSEVESPFCVQLFGSDLQSFEEAAKILKVYKNVDVIDVNMGCPAPKIVNNGAGSALMKNPVLCGKIVETLKTHSSLPVTVKIRAGWDCKSINAPEVAKRCEYGGADAIAVHGRTRTQMYSGTCNLDIIKAVKSSVKIPVIGNGDITTPEAAKHMMDYTLCDMVSVARGALGNPWIFSKINDFLNFGTYQKEIGLAEKTAVMKKHVLKLIKYKGERVGIKEARKHICWYLKSVKGASGYRKTAFSLENLEEFFDFAGSIKDFD